MKQQIDYKQYLASREWRVKRKEFIKECTYGVCQRCTDRPIENVHHLTYANVGNEDNGDLLGVCRPCHEYLAAVRDDDPALIVIQNWIAKYGLRPATLWPGMTRGAWQPFESYNPGREYDAVLMMTLVAEVDYADYGSADPKMLVGPGVLAVFYWL
jgi:hypothetical protein